MAWATQNNESNLIMEKDQNTVSNKKFVTRKETAAMRSELESKFNKVLNDFYKKSKYPKNGITIEVFHKDMFTIGVKTCLNIEFVDFPINERIRS